MFFRYVIFYKLGYNIKADISGDNPMLLFSWKTIKLALYNALIISL